MKTITSRMPGLNTKVRFKLERRQQSVVNRKNHAYELNDITHQNGLYKSKYALLNIFETVVLLSYYR